MAEEDTGSAPATSGWEAILGEPIVSIRDEGWLALRRVDQISPRPQSPPVTVSPSLRWLVLELTPQEEDAAPGPSLPPSLAEQLSLTLAARRQRARSPSALSQPEDPEAWPAPTEATADIEAAREPAPAWRWPLQFLGRLLSRGTISPAAALPQETTPVPAPQPSPPAPAVPPDAPARGTTPQSDDASLADEPAPAPGVPGRTSLGDDTSLPIVLATEPSPKGPGRRAVFPEATIRGVTRARGPDVRPAEGVAPMTEGEPLRPPMPGHAAGSPPPATRSPFATLVSQLTRRRAAEQPSLAEDDSSEGRTAELEQPPATDTRSEEAPPPALVHRVVASEQPPSEAQDDPGEPLSPLLRERMEGLVDVPLSEVRIFRGRIARGVTQRLGADAVSAGPNVFFAPGEGNLASPSGRSLLAHELSHVAPSQDGATRPSEPDEERSALRLEHAVQRQESLDLTGPLQRAGASGTPRSLPSAPAPAAFGPAPLENRAARVAPPAPSFSAGVFGAPNASIAGAGAPPAVARAGRERSPASMEPAASEEEPAAEPDARAGDGAALGQEEQAGLVERTVEAVMRRLRRETDLERERRGAFRSEIGG